MFDYFCPLRGELCNDECEWRSDAGLCVMHHLATALESIADDMHKIVTGPNVEEDV